MNKDFDFLRGHWKVANRRLSRRLQGCTDWETFESVQTNQTLPGDIGNFDDFVAGTWRPAYVGLSLRLFNPVTKLWSIYWLDNQTGGLDAKGRLLPPVVGRFDDGVGVFTGDDELEGQAIRVRYTWSNTDTARPRWVQAMSADGGASWEDNWTMDFEKISPADHAS